MLLLSLLRCGQGSSMPLQGGASCAVLLWHMQLPAFQVSFVIVRSPSSILCFGVDVTAVTSVVLEVCVCCAACFSSSLCLCLGGSSLV